MSEEETYPTLIDLDEGEMMLLNPHEDIRGAAYTTAMESNSGTPMVFLSTRPSRR
ncbi:hypothetical protein RDE2_25450 [Rhodococcus sp. RDE2]|uniref:Uncharacterized protein n=1 Tax=Rhodococcus rhodochrous J45 TaxID=935266 RepID=A0A562E2E8_RHORH|nr:hypothetical protein L618_002800000060 [Rhodococcus rhodochrous J45]BDB60751.1 hypothetical protein RDE2_25450 [Rhodococcus sp. RDE2]